MTDFSGKKAESPLIPVGIRDIANRREHADIVKKLSEGQRRYLNVMLSPAARCLNWQGRADLAGVDTSTAYRMRHTPKWVKAYRELALVYHQGRVPIIWDKMYKNAMASKCNKESSEYLKAIGEFNTTPDKSPVRDERSEQFRRAFDGFIEEMAERKARQILEKRAIEDAEFSVVDEDEADQST